MKLKTRLFMAFFIVILVPLLLSVLFVVGFLLFQADQFRVKYGIDILALPPAEKTIVANMVLSALVILFITALVLSVWLDQGINIPITNLTRAAKNIRDGNLDFELKPEGRITEIMDLYEAFEQMRIRLLQASEAKEVFDQQNRELISNISHDLRTPITAIKGYCEGIMDGVADTPEKRERYIQIIYNKAIEMDRLINELSFYSRITTNRIPYAFDKVSVREFFDDASEALGEDLSAEGIEFTYENELSADVRIIADAEQLTRVLHNIVGNSVKYMDKEEKKISLTVGMTGDEVQVAVADNGRGIPAKDLGNIFERFYRTDASRNSKQGGSGIGLSIVRKIIEDHGGRVWAASKEGSGTTIFFALREYTE